MTWNEMPRNPSKGTLRQFGAIWLVFFLLLAAYQGLVRHRPALGLVLALLAVAVGGLGLIAPMAIRVVFVRWTMLVFPVGWVVSRVALALMFFAILTPLAAILRLTRRDPLQRRPPTDQPSLWAPKATHRDLRRYFGQC